MSEQTQYTAKLNKFSQLVNSSSNISDLTNELKELIPSKDEERTEFATSENLPKFIQLLEFATDESEIDPDQFKLSTSILHLFAESAKTEPARQPLAETEIFKYLQKILKSTFECDKLDETIKYDAKVECLRVVANLCYDNDQNRDYIFETENLIERIVECLNTNDTQLIPKVLGALLNLSMDNEPVQNSILSFGALKTLTGIIKKAKVENVPEYTGMALSALSVLSNLAEADQGVPGLLQSDSFELLFNLLKNEHDSILDESLEDEKYFNSLEFIDSITTLLETIGENDDVQRSIVTKNFLDVLLNFVDHKPKFRAQEADEDSYSFEEIRKTVSRIVTLVTMNDVNMVEITKKPELIARFKQWLTLGTDSDSGVKEDEIRMSGALSIGNLARSDETCISLVQEYGIAQSLLELAVLEKDRVLNCEGRDDKKSAIKVLHAVFGALKNLSLTNENRSPLGKIGLISVCADILELDTLKSIHHPCVGIMKNLCGDNLDNVYRALTGYEPSMKGSFSFKRGSKTPLSQLIARIWKSTGENDIVLRNEGGRVIVNMVRVCGHQREANHLLNALIDFNVVTPLVQIVTGALLTRSNDSESPEESAPPNHGQEETEHHVHFDAVPLDGQFFPIVQNEGIVALIMLLNFKPELVSRVTRYHHSLSPTIMKILASGVIDNVDAIEAESDVKFVDPASDKPQEYNDKIKVNTCMLLTALLPKDELFKTKIAPKLKIVLRALLSKVREHPADESPSRPTSSRPQRFGPVDRTSTKSAKPMLLENSKKEMNASMNFGEEITADGTPSPISLSEAIGIVLLML